MNIATIWHDTVEPETPQDRVEKLEIHQGLLMELEADCRRRSDEISNQIARLKQLTQPKSDEEL